MSLFAEDAYTGPTTIFRSLPQLLLKTQEEEDGEGKGETWWVREGISVWLHMHTWRKTWRLKGKSSVPSSSESLQYQ